VEGYYFVIVLYKREGRNQDYRLNCVDGVTPRSLNVIHKAWRFSAVVFASVPSINYNTDCCASRKRTSNFKQLRKPSAIQDDLPKL
jgi:hypothetical protein